MIGQPLHGNPDILFFDQGAKTPDSKLKKSAKLMTTSEDSTLDSQIEAIKAEIKAEYRMPHKKPWIVGFSGGKDSTLVLHLVIESVLELPSSERTRPIHVVANDTLVESPVVQTYVDDVLETLRSSIPHLHLPIEIVKTKPCLKL